MSIFDPAAPKKTIPFESGEGEGRFALKNKWNVNGKHYSLTLEAWLQNMDREIVTVRKLFNEYYGEDNAVKWIARWRTFFIACSEFLSLSSCI